MEREALILAGVLASWYLLLRTLLTYLVFKHPDRCSAQSALNRV
jgi:hypothetical protein